MKARSERRLGLAWEELHVPSMAPGIRAPLLVLHDRGDEVIPWSDGEAIAAAWPGAKLVTTEGLGHRRLVQEPEVVSRA